MCYLKLVISIIDKATGPHATLISLLVVAVMLASNFIDHPCGPPRGPATVIGVAVGPNKVEAIGAHGNCHGLEVANWDRWHRGALYADGRLLFSDGF